MREVIDPRGSESRSETMRRLIVSDYITLDGVTEAPENWFGDFFEPAIDEVGLEHLKAADTLLFGRKTFEIFASAWPERTGEQADRINSMPKVVASSTLSDPGWNASVVSDNVERHVRALKEESGGDILIYGSGTLTGALAQQGLIDEYRLWQTPTVVGRGSRLFGKGHPAGSFTLTGFKQFDRGVVLLTYQPQASR
jgi:dihydrofolate reductase